MMKPEHKVLFEPIKIGKLEIPNRFSMAPMGTVGLCDASGAYNEKGVEYYAERAKGGTGLIITGVNMVENEIEQFPTPSLPCPTMHPLLYVRKGLELTERVHNYGSKIFAQLTAGWGRSMLPQFGKTFVAPSAQENVFDPEIEHRALTTEEVKTFIQRFAESAAICKKAGFDGVEVHAVHEGYLLDQFTMDFYNQRDDEFGGSFENRFRLPVAILKAIKAVCGEDFPVSLRYSVKSMTKALRQGILPGEDAQEVGRDMEEGLKAAKYLADAGYDALNVDVGTYDAWYWNHPPMYFKDGMYLPFSKQVKEAVDIPVIVAGRLENPDLATRAVMEGAADSISMGRPLLADPHVPNKIRSGDFDRVRPCLSCHMGCLGRMAEGGPISCAVNPACGREKEMALTPAFQKKKVVIVGGGVAGLEAARVAAERGHEAVLFEKNERLGGNVIPGGMPSFKRDDHWLLNWFEGECHRAGVDIRLGVAADKALIESENPDAVLLATGSSPIIPAFKGDYHQHLRVAEDVLMDNSIVGQKVAIIGAGLVGSELALHLAQQGRDITLVDVAEDIVGGPHGLCHANYQMLKELLTFHKVDMRLDTRLEEITDTGATLLDKDGLINCEVDNVVIAVGYKADRDVVNDFMQSLDTKEIYTIGDAQQARTIMTAIWDGFEVARNL